MKTLTDYKFKTELHVHTAPGSPCADIPPKTVVEKFKALGYSTIMITNHFYNGMVNYGNKEKALGHYLADFDAAREEGEKLGINVVLGCEIRFAENSNDYLLYGVNQELLYDLYDYLEGTLSDFAKDFRNEERMIIQAHPFREGNRLSDVSLLDGIEAFNIHPHHNSMIALAAKAASENKRLIVTAGNDYHHEGHEGLSAILTADELKTGEDIIKTLKSRDYLFKVIDSIILPYGL